jgi:phospholipase/lecithinase/hemolysin
MQTKNKALSLALALALGLAACSGGDAGGGPPVAATEGVQSAPLHFAAQVVFGDSLSDVGSYAVGAVAAGGGGKFTINGNGTIQYPELTGQIWDEMIAAQLGLPAPCAAQSGLQGDAARGLSAPAVNHPGCYDYAQGGARIVDPIGPGNVQAGSPIGELTVPIATQVANHLAAAGGRFLGDEVVFVMAGSNDVVTWWRVLADGAGAAAQAAGPDPAAQAQARAAYYAANGPGAVAALQAAGSQLATIIGQQIVGAGANYVVVNNVPDLSGSPLGGVQEPQLRALVQQMVQGFNGALKAGIDALPQAAQVAQVDIYALSQDTLANPANYALTNTTAPACGPNALDGNSLVCNVFNVYPGVDISHFLFADTVHPTPYGHWLIARQVGAAMAAKGWL